jgi:hypothetical protein
MLRACDREFCVVVNIDGTLVSVETVVAFRCLTNNILWARSPLGGSDLVTASLASCPALAELGRILAEGTMLRAHDTGDTLKGTSVYRLAEIVVIPHGLGKLRYYGG